MRVEQGEIWLVPFPFSDLRGRKVRPVFVVSKDQFNDSSDDIIVCGVTSNLSKDYYTVSLDKKDLEEGNLLGASYIKAENILRIDKKLLIKKIGKAKKHIFVDVLKRLNFIFR